MRLSFCLVSLLLTPVSGATTLQDESDSPRYLARVRVMEAQPSLGEVVLAEPDGSALRLAEGDRLPEEEDARLHDVTSTTLVFKKDVTAPDGTKGESLIVVRYDAAGKTKVREYSTVSDVVPPGPTPPGRKPNL